MFILPLYIVLLWAVVWWYRRRWIAFAALFGGIIPIALFTIVCVQFLHIQPNEPSPSWLYFVAILYALLFLIGGMIIACGHRDPAAHPCHRCGYDLVGLTAPTPCPECGTPIRASIPGVRTSTEDEHRPDRLRTPTRDHTGQRVREFVLARQAQRIGKPRRKRSGA